MKTYWRKNLKKKVEGKTVREKMTKESLVERVMGIRQIEGANQRD